MPVCESRADAGMGVIIPSFLLVRAPRWQHPGPAGPAGHLALAGRRGAVGSACRALHLAAGPVSIAMCAPATLVQVRYFPETASSRLRHAGYGAKRRRRSGPSYWLYRAELLAWLKDRSVWWIVMCPDDGQPHRPIRAARVSPPEWERLAQTALSSIYHLPISWVEQA